MNQNLSPAQDIVPKDGEMPQPNGGESAREAVNAAPEGNHDPAVTQTTTVPASVSNQPVPETANGVGNLQPTANGSTSTEVFCGPLLNYRRTSKENTRAPVWHGSVLIVTSPAAPQPRLRLRMLRSEHDDIVVGAGSFNSSVQGDKLYEDTQGTFWAFPLELPFQQRESQWEYVIEGLHKKSRADQSPSEPRHFWIPAKDESFRLMFHSCNGFSVGTDEDAWSGCALWNDVLRVHAKRPIHCMIGGGDQIYNDSIRVKGPLKPWTDISNPRKRRDFPFNQKMRSDCDDFYRKNYQDWYSTEPFATANAQIPQLNIWDDHDIIDGFGSYTDHFMRSPVFRGIGGIAHKYYLLFQHHLPPPKSTFTTDAPQTTTAENGTDTAGSDAVQLKDSWVKIPTEEDPSYIIGNRPGPYVEEKSRSMYARLGARLAFAGIDARTERTRHQINYPETYDLLFQRLEKEVTASQGQIKHLILLLGVPIAYPRLQWLENILQSPLIAPVRLLNKRFGFAGGFFNQFDGGVDLLDDLDDHYTARQHKKERKLLILRLQKLSQQHNLRISILGGDVHLAAYGRFYSNPKLNIRPENDHRFIPNIVSSAITNKPPPTAVANLLARRNKIHHLDHDTNETLLNLWDVDPGKDKGLKPKSATNNHCTMPSRNYALISESNPRSSSSSSSSSSANKVNGTAATAADHDHDTNTAAAADAADAAADFQRSPNPREAQHPGERKAGATHPAANLVDDGEGSSSREASSGLAGEFGLDVCFRVEVDPSDRQGATKGYGVSIPGLTAMGK